MARLRTIGAGLVLGASLALIYGGVRGLGGNLGFGWRWGRSFSPVSPSGSPRPMESQPVEAQAQGQLMEGFHHWCWVTYTPSEFDPTVNPVQQPTPNGVRADLQRLAAAGFRGLVTYRADYYDQDQVRANPEGVEALDLPTIAASLGFRGLVLGMWDPNNPKEWAAVDRQGHHPLVLGFTVGNEGLGRRYDWATLHGAIDRLQQTHGKPVSTSEELPDYFLDRRLRRLGDWLFPNAHPYFAGVKEPGAAAQWTDKQFQNLQGLSTLPVVFKEVGLPSAGDPQVSEVNQREYYQRLHQGSAEFVVFASFDLPWKHSTGQGATPGLDPEPHWGIFKNDRQPKLAVQTLQDYCLGQVINPKLPDS